MSDRPVVALSISESPDLASLGFGPPHLEEAMVEIARFFLISGASLAYGGDLRPGGFTRVLFEMVRTYRRDASENLPVTNYLAWPAHRGLADEKIDELQKEFEGGGRLIFLAPDGSELTMEERRQRVDGSSSEAETSETRAADFTAMRRRMARDCNARLMIGGKVKGYSGAMPGIAEEALLTLEEGRSLYAIGGFGGCTRDLIHALERRSGHDDWPERKPEDVGPGYSRAMSDFGTHSWQDLHNGLSPDENRALAKAGHPSVILRYVLHGRRQAEARENESTLEMSAGA
jgi:hypothetical protein